MDCVGGSGAVTMRVTGSQETGETGRAGELRDNGCQAISYVDDRRPTTAVCLVLPVIT